MTRLSKEQIHALWTSAQNDLVRYLASRLPCEDDARDLAQEAYLRLLRLERGDLVRCPEAYLFRIASNLVHEYWLKERTGIAANKDSKDPDVMPDDGSAIDVRAEQSQSLEILQQALRLLPEMQQKVVLMHRRDGMTYDEIAAELGISRDMVKKYLTKGLARCRERLRRYSHG